MASNRSTPRVRSAQVCRFCECIFTPVTRSDRYCSARCKSYQKRRSVICRNCGVEFCGLARGARFCCEACYKQSFSARLKEKHAATYVPKVTFRPCKRCGKSFVRTSSRKVSCDACAPVLKREYIERYESETKARRTAHTAQYRKKNRDEINRLRRERRRNDSAYAINSRMGCAIRRALREKKAGRSWEEVVGYSREDLKIHLERQFTRGMGWHNMSEWHIDHIVPLSEFSFRDEADAAFRAAWALPNLRPLWASDNMSKQAKRLYLI